MNRDKTVLRLGPETTLAGSPYAAGAAHPQAEARAAVASALRPFEAPSLGMRADNLGADEGPDLWPGGLVPWASSAPTGILASSTPQQSEEPMAASVEDAAAVIRGGLIPSTIGAYAGKMIVGRMQDHIIETADGNLHMVINRGAGANLVMMSSSDGGLTWTTSLSVPGTAQFSTSDLRLTADGTTLGMAYGTADAKVGFAALSYDSRTEDWQFVRTSVVEEGLAEPKSVNPTLALASSGRIYVAYTETLEEGLRVSLNWSDSAGVRWKGGYTVLEGVEAGSVRVSAVGDDVGMFLATSESLEWLEYDRATGWTSTEIDPDGSVGYYASHFTTTVIGNHLFVANVGADRSLTLARYSARSDTWTDLTVPEADHFDLTSVQLSAADTGRLYMVLDDEATGSLVVLESTDRGASWGRVATLDLPGNLVADPVRFEAPEHFSGDLVVMQQVNVSDTDELSGLYSFVVDLDGSGAVSASHLSGQDSFIF